MIQGTIPRRLPRGVAGVVLLSVCAGALLAWALLLSPGHAQQKAAPVENGGQAIEQAKSLSRAFRAAAKQVLPTVVEVRTTTKPPEVDPRLRSENPFRGTPFEDFFGDQPRGFRFYGVPDAPRPGLGSGVIVDPSGLVLTNNHVVADADQVKVQLGDGRVFDVKDIKIDERTDLAVLRLDTNETLPAARFGDSDELEIGDWVLAIGNPFELEQTVSAGIISGKGRSLDAVRRARFLQTDAAINPGNSGGPLVNLNGEVVGINTAIFSRTGGNQGIGFAIPGNLAKWVVPQLMKEGKVARAYLGVSIVDLDAESAKELGVPLGAGVAVAGVGPDSPAAAAGLQKNDVVVAYDGRRIGTTADLQELVERSPADSQHDLKILREDKPLTVKVVVKAMPENFETAMSQSGRLSPSQFYNSRQLGIVVVDPSKELADRLGYEEGGGALIMHVNRDRIAAQAGLREGMLITRVGDTLVKNVAEFREAIEKESLERGIKLEVKTRSGSQVVELKSPSVSN
jgi:serine protease Do